jgi:hypothetical protein
MLEALNEMCMSARNIDLAHLIHKLQVSTPFESENIRGGGGNKRSELGERFGDNARAIDERKFPRTYRLPALPPSTEQYLLSTPERFWKQLSHLGLARPH